MHPTSLPKILQELGCLPQTVRHIGKTRQRLRNKSFVYHIFQFFFRRKVIFLNFERLLKRPSLQFDQVPVVPMENGYFYFGMGDFSYYSHAAIYCFSPKKLILPWNNLVNNAL